MTEQPSGKLYTAVTKYWARIAVSLAALLGISELLIGGLTADSGLELYLTAWAGTTAGVWFLFEKAEVALSATARASVSSWVRKADFESAFRGIPDQFVTLFDQVFGERHLSRRCFSQSAAATTVSIMITWPLVFGIMYLNELATGGGILENSNLTALGLIGAHMVIVAGAILLSLVPDYLSLLETRWIFGRVRASGSLGAALVIDLILTSVVAIGFQLAVVLSYDAFIGNGPGDLLGLMLAGGIVLGTPSTFFTSLWLWLYALSVPLSRLLLRMNNGVGFLLRVTDVEKQPFRSMGFVSVIIVSALFALGLPLVLL